MLVVVEQALGDVERDDVVGTHCLSAVKKTNGLQELTENSYRSPEDRLLNWRSVLEHTYC